MQDKRKSTNVMVGYAQKFVPNIFYGILSQIIRFLVSAFVIGYLVRCLGPEQWGLVVFASSMVSLMALVQLGASAGIGKRLNTFIVKGQDKEFTQYFSAANFVCAAMVLVMIVILTLLVTIYWSMLKISPEYAFEGKVVLVLMGIAMAISTVNLPITACLQAKHRVDINAKLNMVALITRAVTCIVLFEILGPSAILYAFIIVFARLIVYLGGVFWVRKNIHLARMKVSTVTFSVTKSLIHFNLLTLFNSLNYAIFIQVPAMLLQRFAGFTVVGFYGISQQITVLSRSFMVVGVNAIQPVAISLASSSKNNKVVDVFCLSSKFYIFAGALLWFVFYYLGESFLNLWLRRDVGELAAALPWLMGAAAVGIMALPSAVFTVAIEKLRLAGLGGLVLAGVMIGCMYFFLKEGAASLEEGAIIPIEAAILPIAGSISLTEGTSSPLLIVSKLLLCFFGAYQLLRMWVVIYNLKITLLGIIRQLIVRPMGALIIPALYLFWISKKFGQIDSIANFVLICLGCLLIAAFAVLFILFDKNDWALIKKVFSSARRKSQNG